MNRSQTTERRHDTAPSPADEEEATGEQFWQWVSLIVLLACWLAEASMMGDV
jgi:hypothetical protein